MTRKKRTSLAAAGVALSLLGAPFLFLGVAALGTNHFAWGERVQETEEFGLSITSPSIHEVWFGPIHLTGEAVWAVPLIVGSGGLLGGLALLLWAWRAEPPADAHTLDKEQRPAK